MYLFNKKGEDETITVDMLIFKIMLVLNTNKLEYSGKLEP